jgi:N-acetylmuramoyl-L-alanine amidase
MPQARAKACVNHDTPTCIPCAPSAPTTIEPALPILRDIRSGLRRPAIAMAAVALAWLTALVPVAAPAPVHAAAPPGRGPVITQVFLGMEAETASLVIDMSHEANPQISASISPPRLFLDFEGARFHAPAVAPAEGPVRALRFGAFMRGQGRLILDLAQPLRIAEQRFLPLDGGGARLVILFAQASPEAFRLMAQPAPDDIATGTVDPRPEGAELPLVVLDPGHGGIDTGATGPAGEQEKGIVLQFATALKERIERGGKARVLMTRSSDVFVPLRDRVRIARQARAQLFISLHADALADEESVRGASVYVLSERATDERSARLADKENRADLAAGIETRDDQDEVADILFDLARRESRAFSNQFARQLATTLPKATRMHRNALRGAAFRVLRAPDVPSVLLELGYLTTAEDAKLMQSETWRRQTADAAAEAIERFVEDRIRKSGR